MLETIELKYLVKDNIRGQLWEVFGKVIKEQDRKTIVYYCVPYGNNIMDSTWFEREDLTIVEKRVL